MRAITHEDEERFTQLRDAIDRDRTALVATEFGGVELVAVAEVFREDETGDFHIVPLALLVSDELFGSLVHPAADLENGASESEYACPFGCGVTTDTPDAMNAHFDAEHADDDEVSL